MSEATEASSTPCVEMPMSINACAVRVASSHKHNVSILKIIDNRRNQATSIVTQTQSTVAYEQKKKKKGEKDKEKEVCVENKQKQKGEEETEGINGDVPERETG